MLHTANFNCILRTGFLSLLFIFLIIKAEAQVRPSPTATGVAAKTSTKAVYQEPDPVSGTVVNSVAVFTPQQAGYLTETAVKSVSNTVEQVNIGTQYFDGLGRPVQTVGWQASPTKKDLVAPAAYNQFGQEEYKFLPYSGGTDGNFKMKAFSDQSTFYKSTILSSEPAYKDEQFYYSHINYEPSPLNRVSSTFAPGNAWAGSEGGSAEKAVSVKYLVNTVDDHVRIWTIGFSAVADANNIPASTSEYGAGTLYKTVTTDESGNATVEYKDVEGHVLLKKVQTVTNIGANYSGYTDFLCTYYVYDDLGQLRFVISPKAVNYIATATTPWVITTAIANELCFRYEYDERQRMKAKRVPGADWVYMVYDARDRLVYTQDGNLRAKSPDQWTYTLYDQLNRPVQTGIMSYSDTWANLAKDAASTSNANFIANDNGSYINGIPADLFVNSRDFGADTYQATNSITWSEGFITETNAKVTAEIVPATPVNFTIPPEVVLSPLPASGTYTLYPQTYTYYDDYGFSPTKSYTKDYNGALKTYTEENSQGNPIATLEALPDLKSTQTIGFVTGARIKVLEDPTDLTKGAWMETDNFYDDKGRPVQVQSDNYKGGVDISITRYNFINKAIGTLLVHSNPQAGKSGNNNITAYTRIKYDHAGRAMQVNKKITYKSFSYSRILAINNYDELGNMIRKQTGQKSSINTAAAEDDSYSYNLRGWLKGINWYAGTTYTSQMSSFNAKWFAYDLSYDWGMTTNQFNGNISGMRWKSAGDRKERAFGFSYDNVNRLLKGDFSQKNGSWGTDPILNFDVKMGDGSAASSAYDENGNIKMMQQYGLVGIASKQIDNLGYEYKKSGTTTTLTNKLYAVTEGAGVGTTDNKVGDFTDNNTSGDDYTYDVNGNLTADKNKRIQTISYNQLNLPYQVSVLDASNNQKGTITYIYDALGNKLEKRVKELIPTAKETLTTYLGAFTFRKVLIGLTLTRLHHIVIFLKMLFTSMPRNLISAT